MPHGNINAAEIANEIAASEDILNADDQRGANLWKRVRITPEQWAHGQYPEEEKVWVVATMGNHCLYFNYVEGGWGWGGFQQWGQVSQYHWEQLEIHHVIYQTLWAIDHD